MDVELVAPFQLTYAYTRSTGPVLGRFLGALRDRRLEGMRTRSGEVLVPPSECDPRTGETLCDDWVEVGPEGEIVAYTFVAAPRPTHPLAEPFAFALVRLDGASTPMLHVVRAPEAALRAGLRVRPVWREERTGSVRDLLAFEPVRGSAGEGA
jgi:uncharacterized OB-fold protein